MAASVTQVGVPAQVEGALRFAPVLITFDSSYPTGGYAITAAQLGFDATVLALLPSAATTSGNWLCAVNETTDKIKVIDHLTGGTGTECTATTDLHLESVFCVAYGL